MTRLERDNTQAITDDIAADESLLSGESAPVRKRPAVVEDTDAAPVPGGDDQPFVYAGSMITRGSGIARVIATGAASQMGRIGRSLAVLEFETSVDGKHVNGVDIVRCDDEGRIVERGTEAELRAAGGRYAHLLGGASGPALADDQ